MLLGCLLSTHRSYSDIYVYDLYRQQVWWPVIWITSQLPFHGFDYVLCDICGTDTGEPA